VRRRRVHHREGLLAVGVIGRRLGRHHEDELAARARDVCAATAREPDTPGRRRPRAGARPSATSRTGSSAAAGAIGFGEASEGPSRPPPMTIRA
jgi:hypothetical protein